MLAGMERLLTVGEAASYLGISSGELLKLQWHDLLPWHSTDGLPAFSRSELAAFRPRVQQALAGADDVERRASGKPRPSSTSGTRKPCDLQGFLDFLDLFLDPT